MARTKPREKTQMECLMLGLKVTRIDELNFRVPSESDPEKSWIVNIKDKTCRDQDGKGCIPMFHWRTCKHYQSVSLISILLEKWTIYE